MIGLPQMRGALASAFNPLSLSPALWLDASDGATLLDAGGAAADPDEAVATWNDKSGNSRHVAQSSAALRPLKIAAAYNGKSAVRFGSVNQSQLVLGSNGLLRNVVGATVFVCRKWSTNPTAPNIRYTFALATGAGTARLFLDGGRTTGKTSVGGRTLDGDTFQSFASADTLSTSVPQIDVAVVDYAATDAFLFTNKAANGSTTSWQSATRTSDTNSTALGIGNSGTTDINPFVGDLLEILVYHFALATAQRNQVETYLAAKWAITLS